MTEKTTKLTPEQAVLLVIVRDLNAQNRTNERDKTIAEAYAGAVFNKISEGRLKREGEGFVSLQVKLRDLCAAGLLTSCDLDRKTRSGILKDIYYELTEAGTEAIRK